jgi:hypothetical protein
MEYHETVKLAAKRTDWVGCLVGTLGYFVFRTVPGHSIHYIVNCTHTREQNLSNF